MIIAIIIASVVAISIIICCARCLCCGLSCCCDCLSCFRGRGRKRARYADAPSAFNPAPYQGYQPANSPHGYRPPQFAQFDTGRNRNTIGGKVNEDSLPAMPSWDNATERKVFDETHEEDVEMGKLDPQKAPMLAHQAPAPTTGYSHTGLPSPGMPYQQHSATQGGDVGSHYGPGSPSPYSHNSSTGPQQYHSPDDVLVHHSMPSQQAYSAYAPSESTRYEPSTVYGGQETGTAYPSQSTYTPNVLQAGRQPAGGSFRDV